MSKSALSGQKPAVNALLVRISYLGFWAVAGLCCQQVFLPVGLSCAPGDKRVARHIEGHLGAAAQVRTLLRYEYACAGCFVARF